MRVLTALPLLGLLAIVASGCAAPAPAPEPEPEPEPAPAGRPGQVGPSYVEVGAAPCEPVGEIQFVCDLVSPEDLAVVPGDEWVITSGNREGGRLHLVSVADRTATVLFPTPEPGARLDAATYPTCPGPLDLDEPDAFRAHGLHLQPGQGDVHTLYVVHHGTRESVEVFEVDAQAAPPALTWVGCVPALSTIRINSVVPLPGGGVAGTNGSLGNIWAWKAGEGWAPIPGTDDTAPNGLEISKDGRWLYIAGWREETLTRVSLDQTPVQRDVIELGFRPDNVRMSADGSTLFAAGHTDKDLQSIVEPREPLMESSNVARIDPETLDFERIFQHPSMPGFVASTTAVPVGNELWLGSQRGDRIAYLPLPQ